MSRTYFNPVLAEKALIEYISTGMYSERTACKNNKSTAQEELKLMVQEFGQKRTVYDIGGHSVVTKFVKKEVVEIDHAAMISDILNYIRSEGLSQIITLNPKSFNEETVDISIADNYMYKNSYYTKFTPNKFGKSFNLDGAEDLFGLSAEELILRILFLKDAYKMYQAHHERVMRNFIGMEEKQFKTAIGSVSKIANKPIWDVNQMTLDFGDDFLINHGKVKVSNLERFFDMGALPPEILWNNRTVVDHNVEFHVMTLEAEARALAAYQYKQDKRQALLQQRFAK